MGQTANAGTGGVSPATGGGGPTSNNSNNNGSSGCMATQLSSTAASATTLPPHTAHTTNGIIGGGSGGPTPVIPINNKLNYKVSRHDIYREHLKEVQRVVRLTIVCLF